MENIDASIPLYHINITQILFLLIFRVNLSVHALMYASTRVLLVVITFSSFATINVTL